MLRYTTTESGDGITVVFHEIRQRAKALVASCALIFIGIGTAYFLPWRMAIGASAKLSADFMIIFALPLCVAVFVIGCLVLHRNLLQRRFVFQADGIRDRTSFPGVSREGKLYSRNGIHAFGYGVIEYSEMPVLKFSFVGEKDYVVLAERVSESEAAGFVAFLDGHGFAYAESAQEAA
jgi:hypothetical protein